jgi:hypothetical protein
MITVPTVVQLADWSGRPEASYSGFATSALLQATIMFATVTELTPDDFGTLAAETDSGGQTADYQLAIQGILAMADYVYLRQPYQQVIASPLTSENIGSYSYAKAASQVGRNAAALEVTGENTGITLYDLAVQFLAKRTRAGGVSTGGITVFEEGSEIDSAQMMIRNGDGRICILGPSDRDQFDIPFDVNAESFPVDPGF